MRRVLVTGSSGHLGEALVRDAIAGVDVAAPRRSPPRLTQLVEIDVMQRKCE